MAIYKLFTLILCGSALTSMLDAYSNNAVFSGIEASGKALESFASSLLNVQERAKEMKEKFKNNDGTKENDTSNKKQKNKRQKDKKQVSLYDSKQPKTVVYKNQNNSSSKQYFNNSQKYHQKNTSPKQQSNNTWKKNNQSNLNKNSKKNNLNNHTTNNKQNKKSVKQIAVNKKSSPRTIVRKK
jgi:hypothetical protein